MKLKFRLSIIVVTLLAVVVASTSTILIVQAANIQLHTAEGSRQRLAEGIATDTQRRYEVYLQTARNLATLMGDYERYNPEDAKNQVEIRNAMEEQGAGSKQILEAISRLNNITRMVKSGSEEMASGSKGVINESHNLEMLTQEINNRMSEMASSAGHINVSVHHVNGISVENKDNINVLIKEIAKFKVE
jgi:methyl-accepting chemotaxis protein